MNGEMIKINKYFLVKLGIEYSEDYDFDSSELKECLNTLNFDTTVFEIGEEVFE